MKKLNSISSLSFLIVLYVSRNAIPYVAYPLMVLLLTFTLFQFVNFKNVKQALVKSIRMFFPVILLIIIELIALFCTAFPFHGRSLDIIKDIFFITTFLFLLSCHIRSKDDFNLLINKISKYFVLFSIIVSLLGLWKFFYSPDFISYKTVEGIRGFKWGASLVADYNFFSLFLLNGLIFGLYTILNSPEKIKYKTLFLLALQLIIFIGFLSGSRRYVFCLGFFFIACLLLLIPFLYKKIFSNKISYKYLLIFLSFSVFNFGIIYSFLSYFPLVSQKAEKLLYIDAHKTDLNVVTVAKRMNSVASFRFITVRSANQQINDIVDSELVSVTASRQDLWDLGKKIYAEYSISQKIFGNGFSFFNTFKQETERFLYPHHLFLSVLLFSGILGLTLYIAILLWSSIIYLFHLKKLGALCFIFIINFTFAFFSFTDFFGASFYALLFILPLLYRNLLINEKKHNIVQNITKN